MFKDIVARKKDGTAMKGSLNLTPMLDSAGNVTALLAIILDVTEQKAMETQFYQAQKMDVVGKLTGGIAHDFNNMLAIILGDGEILQNLLKEQPDNRACADEIVKAGKKAALLTKQLLAFSRQAVLSPILLDLNVQIAEMEQMLKRLVGEHIKISMVFPPEPVMVYFGPSRLDQVIMNLVVNARDAMSSGGYINIKVSRISIEKDLEIYNSQKIIPGNYAVIEVSDTGTGIAPEVKAKIFAPFFTTKEAGKGTGLGLSVVHDIVCKSGGFIDIDTVLDKGSTFKIYLKSLDQKTLADTAEIIKSAKGGNETILLVEDNEGLLKLTAGILRNYGYAVIEANNPGQALLIAEKQKSSIKMLFTDILMPEMDGLELAKKIALISKDIRVLYFSGFTDFSLMPEGIIDKKISYLQKPFTTQELLTSVRKVLDVEKGKKTT